MQRRFFSTSLVSSLAMAAIPVWAQTSFPNKPIKFIVPYAPGGLPDVVARVLSQRLGERLGQPIVVENKAGGAGVIAYNALQQSQPTDGHAYILSDGAMLSISPHINKAANYKIGRDLFPVSLIGRAPLFLVAHSKTGVNSLQEFVAQVRKRPGEYTYGSSGIGSNHHLTMEALKAELQLDLRHVPFRGSGQSTPALVAGQVDFSIAALPSISSFVQNGQLKVLASQAGTRSALAPSIPTIAETIPGFDYGPLLVLLAAPGTPAQATDRMQREIAEIVKHPEVIKSFNVAAVEPVGSGPEDAANALQREVDAMARSAKFAQLKPE